MSLFDAVRKAFASGAKEINKEYGKSQDFLLAVTAGSALIIYADGTAEESEKKMAMDVLTGHTQLSAIYQRSDIESALSKALSHGTTSSGRHELGRALDKVLQLSNGREMADDVYLMAVDIAHSNSRGSVGPDEEKVLGLIAKHLQVDASKFEF